MSSRTLLSGQETNLDIRPLYGSSVVGAALVSFYVCSLIAVLFLISTAEIRHWFVVPLLACGTIVGIDVVRLVRGRTHIFEPIGFVGLLGLHFFFLAPMLHVRWDYWALYVTPVEDWRYWLGRMAILNFISLCLYISVRSAILKLGRPRSTSSYWQLDRGRFYKVSLVCLGLTASLQAFVYYQFGGITGYIGSYEEGAGAFESMGIVFAISESFPIVAMMMFVVWAADSEKRQGWLLIFAALAGFFIARMLFGGLRGSRSNTILALFWAAGLIHIWVRPFSRRMLVIGAAFVLLFMYAYGFYKALGTDAIAALSTGTSLSDLEESTGRTWEGLFLGDLGRSDIQALIYAHLSPGAEKLEYSYALGRTYLGAISLPIPGWIWEDRPATKVQWSTNLLYGKGFSHEGGLVSSRAHGIAGEAMLNLGPLSVPIAYVLFGAVVGLAQRWWEELRSKDGRLLIAPLVTTFAFYFLVWDSDNIVYFTVKNGLVPAIILLLSIRVVRMNNQLRTTLT